MRRETLLCLFIISALLLQTQVASAATYIVAYESSSSQKELKANVFNFGLKLKQSFPQLKMSVIQGSPQQMQEYYDSSKDQIRYIEPEYKWSIDESFPKSVSPMPKQGQGLWGMKAINAPDAWAITQGNKNIIVAITDTGTCLDHPELKPNLWKNSGEVGADSLGKNKSKNKSDDDHNGYNDDVYGWNFLSDNNDIQDNHYHGTHVAGTIGATAQDNAGIMGVSPNVSLMTMKFLSDLGIGNTTGALRAIIYAVNNGAKVINASWGGDHYSQAMYEALQYANKRGVLFIAAAGNDHADNDTFDGKPRYPASYKLDNVISVAASNKKMEIASFSNWGLLSVLIAAPGDSIYSTFNLLLRTSATSTSYETMSGTSMAAPHVAGAAALVWAANPNLTHLQVKDILISTVTRTPQWGKLVVSGGVLNVGEAVKKALSYK